MNRDFQLLCFAIFLWASTDTISGGTETQQPWISKHLLHLPLADLYFKHACIIKKKKKLTLTHSSYHFASAMRKNKSGSNWGQLSTVAELAAPYLNPRAYHMPQKEEDIHIGTARYATICTQCVILCYSILSFYSYKPKILSWWFWHS